MKRRLEEGLNRLTDTICLGEWAEEYLDYAKAKFTKRTYEEKRQIFKRFFLYVDPALPVSKLTSKQVLDYLKKQAEERSGYAANKERKNLLAAYNWGIKYLGLPTSNPCLVERFPEMRHPRYVPPVEDFWRVYDAAEGQDRVMLLAFLHLAPRRSELFRLKWEDVDFDNQRVRLYTRKRRDGMWEFDWLPMTDELYNSLLAHRQNSKSPYVFTDPQSNLAFRYRRHLMRRLCQKAGVRHFGFHAIRHLTASILANEGVSTIVIQHILRHKNLSTTERYLHSLTDLKYALGILSRNKKPSKKPSIRKTEKNHLRVVSKKSNLLKF